MTRRTRLPTPHELAQHARQLAQAFGVLLVESQDILTEHSAVVNGKLVVTGIIKDELTYAVALHEIGHCVAPLGAIQRNVPPTAAQALEQEYEAWRWAEHYALDWSPTMQHAKQFGLNGYEAAARRELELKLKPRQRETLDAFMKRTGRK